MNDYLSFSFKIKNNGVRVRVWNGPDKLFRCEKPGIRTEGHGLAELLIACVEGGALNFNAPKGRAAHVNFAEIMKHNFVFAVR